MSYKPKNRSIRIGDTWQYSDGENVQVFYLQNQQAGEPSAGREVGAIGHAKSSDLLKWETLPSALYCGETGSYDDLEMWTGCTIKENDRLYLYYTSRSSTSYMFSISAAVSDDGINFTKMPQNPLIVPAEKYYYTKTAPCPYAMHGNNGFNTYDCRDMCVVKDPSGEFWWGYFAARQPADECPKTTVIGLAKSYDLVHWEQLPPCFVPDRYHCVETPDVFYMNEKWYMLCLAGNIYGQRRSTDDELPFQLITIYATADRPEGPYTEPEDNLLISTMAHSGNCAKTVFHKGKRYLYHLEVFWRSDGSSEILMSPPKTLEIDSNGKLYAGLYEGYSAYYDKCIIPARENILPKAGEWGSYGRWEFGDGYAKGCCKTDWCVQPLDIVSHDFIMEADISSTDTESAGFVFGLTDNIFTSGHTVLLDYRQNRVFLTKTRTFNILDGRTMPLRRDKMHLTLLCAGCTCEVYLDGRLVFNHPLEMNSGHPGYHIEKGSAVFTNVKIHTFKPF